MVASCSDYVDTYVGVGARRVRELFEGAKIDARNGWLNRNRRSRIGYKFINCTIRTQKQFYLFYFTLI